VLPEQKMSSRSGFFAGLVRGWLHLRGGRGCVLLILIAALMPVVGRAQDVAEAARQEKSRRSSQGPRQSHIYTNEDLQKTEILSQDERAAMEARRRISDSAAENASAARVSTKPAPNRPAIDDEEKVVASESLGEVARRYRREKAMRQAERASADLPESQFHLAVTTPVLAEIAPRGVLSARASVLPPAAKSRVKVSEAPRRRDPFARPGTGQLGIANRPATNGSRAAFADALPGDTAAKEIVAPNAREAHTALRAANSGADAVVGMTRPKGAPPMIATGIPMVSRPEANLVVAPAGEMVVVRAGDSLWSLSRRYSGVGAQWRGWLAANPGIEEKRLRPGMRLVRPGVAATVGVASPLGIAHAGNTITVRSGDSFWKIAAERYGAGQLWPCIARANPEWRDVAKIYPGQSLIVPAACGK
jgi:nucleoid-associated protein YgaU